MTPSTTCEIVGQIGLRVEPCVLLRKDSRCKQSRRNAYLTDHEVELMRKLHEQGMSYKRISITFELPTSTVQFICTYRRRGMRR